MYVHQEMHVHVHGMQELWMDGYSIALEML